MPPLPRNFAPTPDTLSLDSVKISKPDDMPPPLPLSPPPQIEEEPSTFSLEEPNTNPVSPPRLFSKKVTAPTPPQRKVVVPTNVLPSIPPPAYEVPVSSQFNGHSQEKMKEKEKATEKAKEKSNEIPKAQSNQNPLLSQPKLTNQEQMSPKIIRIGQTTPPPVQKPSKIRSLFGFSSNNTVETPKKKAKEEKIKVKRIRVPKQPKSPEGLPRSASSPQFVNENLKNGPMADTHSMNSIKSSPRDKKKPTKSATPSPVNKTKSSPKNKLNTQEPSRVLKLEGFDDGFDNESSSSPPVFQKIGKKSKQATSAKLKQLKFADNATVITDDTEEDSWDLVAKHRASINQAAIQVKNTKQVVNNNNGSEMRRVEFVPIEDEKPKTMREMRKSQSVGAGNNLRNKVLNAMDDVSDTEA